MKKICLLVILIFCCGVTMSNVYSQDALSIGTNFGIDGNVDSTAEATFAAQSFNSMGYNSALVTIPTKNVISTRIDLYNSSGTTAGAMFLHGHGSQNYIRWNYLGTGGEYSVGFSKSFSTGESRYNHLIEEFNLSKTKMIVFMGCNTAQGTDNISKYSQTKGVTVTTGWVYLIYDTDTDRWTQYFFNKLKSGSTFKEAYKYANSFNYTHNENMKTHRVYGDSSVSLKLNSSKTNVNEVYTSDFRNSQKYNYSDINIVENNIEMVIRDKFDSTFDKSNYIFEKSYAPDAIIYDYNLIIDDGKSNYGYTVFVYDEYFEIYDNTADALITKETNSSTCSANDYNNLQKIVDNLLIQLKKEYDDYSISIDSTIKRYDEKIGRSVYDVNFLFFDKNNKTNFVVTKTLY